MAKYPWQQAKRTGNIRHLVHMSHPMKYHERKMSALAYIPIHVTAATLTRVHTPQNSKWKTKTTRQRAKSTSTLTSAERRGPSVWQHAEGHSQQTGRLVKCRLIALHNAALMTWIKTLTSVWLEQCRALKGWQTVSQTLVNLSANINTPTLQVAVAVCNVRLFCCVADHKVAVNMQFHVTAYQSKKNMRIVFPLNKYPLLKFSWGFCRVSPWFKKLKS